MKKFSKVLAITLVLASLLSLFGIFAAFAEDAEGYTSPTGLKPNQTFNMDEDLTKITISNPVTITRDDGSSVAGMTVKKYTDNGTYWILQSNAKAGEKHGSGSFFNMTNPSYSIGDSTSAKEKVDFFVIDLDIATDTSFMDFYFHQRLLNSAGANVQHGKAYPGIYGDDFDNVNLAVRKTSGKTTVYDAATAGYPTVTTNDEWMNVTFVFDYRGNEYANWKCHAYIDGYYVATFDATSSSDSSVASHTSFIRPSFQDVAVSDYESLKFRNWTYTNFPVGWDGDMAETGMVGSYAVHLSEIEELNYCLEDTNADRGNIATITDADGNERIARTFEDLDCNFRDGDVVTLNRNVATPILVNANNVTFVDNGKTYKLVDTSSVDFSTAKFIAQKRLDRSIVTSGDAEAFATYALTDAYVVQLLDDLTWTRENGSKGSYAYARHFTFEMNGHKLTLASGNRHFDLSSGEGGVLVFKNGEFSFAGVYDSTDKSHGDFTMLNNNNAIIFDNLKPLSIDSAETFLDQRHGLILFRDSEIKINKNVNPISAKGSAARRSAVKFIGCDVEQTVKGTAAFMNIANYASSGVRYGGLNLNIDMIDTDINWTRTIFSVEAYTNMANIVIDDDGTVRCTSTKTYAKNYFDIDINFENCDIISTERYYIADVNIKDLTHNIATESNDYNGNDVTKEEITLTSDKYYKADGLYIDFDLTANDSMFACYDVIRRIHDVGTASSDIKWTNDINVEVTGDSYLDVDVGIIYDISAKADAGHITTLTIDEGVKLQNNIINRQGNKNNVTNVTLGDGTAKLAHTNTNGDYGIIVSSAYDTYSYKLGEKAAVPFYWNKAEGEVVNINNVTTLAAGNAAYTYSWNDPVDGVYTTKMNPTFKPEVNLTTNGTIAINMYIPTEVYEVIKGAIAVDTEYTVEYELGAVMGEKEYAKLSIKGVAPKNAEDVVANVALTINGAYDDKIDGDWDLSVVDYCARVLDNENTTEADKDYVLALLNYISAVYTYENKEATAADALLGEAKFDAVSLGDAKYKAAEGITGASLTLGSSISWKLTVDEAYKDTIYAITYYVNGVEYNVNRKANADNEIILTVRAYDALKDVVINGATVNLAGYAEQPAVAGAADVIAALAIYADAAATYNNVALYND